jgi:hypothetical protein
MKKVLIQLLLISFLYSCTNKQISNIGTQLSQNQPRESLIGKINKEISRTKINDQAIYILNGVEFDKNELEYLNQLPLEDFIDVIALNKDVATKIYGQKGSNGAVVLTSFTDELLDIDYYSALDNETVVNAISKFNSQGLINKNPILVINGIPLRGEDIASKINALEQNNISEISLLKKQTAYSIYGIRAMNGVLLIDIK